MTKERLKKLRALLKEAEHLEEEIRNLPFRTGDYVADSAKDYRTGYPRVITIRGYSAKEYYRLKRKQESALRKIQDEIAEMETWLDGVEDPQTRDILRLQYINGLTQEQIAEELGKDVRTIKRWLHKFWEQYGNVL